MISLRHKGQSLWVGLGGGLWQKDGTEKKTVLKYQLANVTTRPRSPMDDESKESCKRKNNEAERKQAKKITNILDHISGNDEDMQAALVSKVIDQKGSLAEVSPAHLLLCQFPELPPCRPQCCCRPPWPCRQQPTWADLICHPAFSS